MDRASFLRRALAAWAGLYLGPRLPAAAAEPELALGVIRDSLLTSTNDYQIFRGTLVATGGICAPVAPLYEILPLASRPVRDAFPTFQAVSGDGKEKR